MVVKKKRALGCELVDMGSSPSCEYPVLDIKEQNLSPTIFTLNDSIFQQHTNKRWHPNTLMNL